MDSDLQETPVERFYLVDGGSVLIAHPRHQHAMDGTVFVGAPVDPVTLEPLPQEHLVVHASGISNRVAIGRAPDGTYQDAPGLSRWSDRT